LELIGEAGTSEKKEGGIKGFVVCVFLYSLFSQLLLGV
jgi:hypothetical protein